MARRASEERVPIKCPDDIVVARQQARAWATLLGFSTSESTLIATAVSELVRNILTYAGSGEIIFRSSGGNSGGHGLQIVARDKGPGIADIDNALSKGHSTAGGLGLGLPGVRRVMDDFKISSQIGRGTTVTVRKNR